MNIQDHTLEDLEQEIVSRSIKNLEYSQANISNHKVGACLIASSSNGIKLFDGSNIELSHSTCWHAEEIALVKAISEGYIIPELVCVTSTSKTQQAALCGYCRQHFMYVNPECKILVVDLDGKILIQTTVIKTMNYPYLAKYQLKPIKPKS